MKFTVHMLRPYVSWENVEADNRDAAIEKCRNAPDVSSVYDCNEITSWIATEEEEEPVKEVCDE